MPRHYRTLTIALLALAVAGCEGARNNSSWSTAEPGTAIVPPLDSAYEANKVAAAAEVHAATDKGVGPVDKVDISSLDSARALAGSELFPVKCSACHKLEERYIGPALAGVTTRRQPEWILNMILNPEKMIQQDPTAKALLAEYIAPMANQSLTREQAEDILAYLLEHDAAMTAPADTNAEANSETAAPVNPR
jgi:mono/diheme cytochrome c family protein